MLRECTAVAAQRAKANYQPRKHFRSQCFTTLDLDVEISGDADITVLGHEFNFDFGPTETVAPCFSS